MIIIDPNCNAETELKHREVVCISGSMRFAEQMKIAAENLRDRGYVALYPSIQYYDYFTDEIARGYSADQLETIEKMLDNMFYDMHLQKIDMCDELLVCNIGGYIGEKVQMEIQYAISKGKSISYLEPVDRIVEETKEEKKQKFYVVLGASQYYTEVYEKCLELSQKEISVANPFLISDDYDQFMHVSFKSTFDELILRQIDQADVLYIVNVKDHINPDMFSFIMHAEKEGIEVRYTEEHIPFDTEPFKMGEKVKIIDGSLKGRIANYFCPYPYPDGGSGHVLVLLDKLNKNGIPERVKVNRDEIERAGK